MTAPRVRPEPLWVASARGCPPHDQRGAWSKPLRLVLPSKMRLGLISGLGRIVALSIPLHCKCLDICCEVGPLLPPQAPGQLGAHVRQLGRCSRLNRTAATQLPPTGQAIHNASTMKSDLQGHAVLCSVKRNTNPSPSPVSPFLIPCHSCGHRTRLGHQSRSGTTLSQAVSPGLALLAAPPPAPLQRPRTTPGHPCAPRQNRTAHLNADDKGSLPCPREQTHSFRKPKRASVRPQKVSALEPRAASYFLYQGVRLFYSKLPQNAGKIRQNPYSGDCNPPWPKCVHGRTTAGAVAATVPAGGTAALRTHAPL